MMIGKWWVEHIILLVGLAAAYEDQWEEHIQTVDCYGEDGCQGGWPAAALSYVAANGRQDSDSFYPYTSNTELYNWTSVAEDCKYDPLEVAATVSASQPVLTLKEYDITARMAALAENQLVIVTMAVPNHFFHFKEGLDSIFDGPCKKSQNHAVVLVGYGTSEEHGIDYWIVRNSWGDDWAQGGYWLIHRGVDMCGIEQHAWVTTASTNDVPLGARYDFDWTKSSDGKFTYSNCSYNGKTMKSVEDYTTADECGTLCSNTSNCDVFSWWGGNCDMKSNSTQPIIALASGDGICGYVNSDDETTLDAAGNNQDTQCESSDKVGCNQIVETEVEETITITQGKKGKSRK